MRTVASPVPLTAEASSHSVPVIARKTAPISIPLGFRIVGRPHWVRPLYVGTVESVE